MRLFVVAAILLAGCQEPLELQVGTEGMLYERLVTCRGYDASADAYTRHVTKYPNDFEGMRACSRHGGCEAFNGCFEAASEAVDPRRRAERVGEDVAELEDAVRTGRWAEAEELCADLAVDFDLPPKVPETCEGLPALAVRGLTAAITALRDLPGVGVGHLARCEELRRYAGGISPEAERRARALCREAALSVDVYDILARVEARIEAADPRLPPGCAAGVEALGGLATPWAVRLQRALVTTCYVKLGKVILDVRRAGRCPPPVRRLLLAADQHGDPVSTRLGPPLDRARADCR